VSEFPLGGAPGLAAAVPSASGPGQATHLTGCGGRPGWVRPGRGCRERRGVMTGQPMHEGGPDDPVEILHVLPARFHEQFLAG